LSLWAHLPRSPPAIQTSTPPLPPSSSNTPAQRASNALARSSMLPRARRDLAIVDRDSPPHTRRQLSHSRPNTGISPNYPAQSTLSVSAVPAWDAGGLRCRARACASATGGRREELARPGRSGGQPAELRSSRAPAPRRTCRQPTVRKVRRHRNRPAIGGKGVGTVGVVACAPWGAVFGLAHVHRGSA
jgi:hypothetical protein